VINFTADRSFMRCNAGLNCRTSSSCLP